MSAFVPEEIRSALRRRGIVLRDDEGAARDLWVTAWPEARRDGLYREMQRYSFRLLLRDVIQMGQARDVQAEDLARHAHVDAARAHLEALEALSLVRRSGERYALAEPARSLGPLLEWFVAEVLRRELGFVVACAVPLRGGSTGGDVDVVAVAEGQLVLVEVKSGPPKHLNRSHVDAFLDRVAALAPHGAVFFEDTELRMQDKIVPLFEEALAARGVSRAVLRLHRELFTAGPGLYIANAYPDVAGNLGRCVGHLVRGRGLQLGMDREAGER